MSRENVDMVRTFYDAWNRPDRAAATLPLLHPEFEWVNPDYAVEPGVRRGHAGFMRVLRRLDDAFDRYEHLPGKLIDAGDKVLCYASFRARARGGGVEFEKAEPHVWTVRDAKIVRLEWFHDERQALGALGLRG